MACIASPDAMDAICYRTSKFVWRIYRRSIYSNIFVPIYIYFIYIIYNMSYIL